MYCVSGSEESLLLYSFCGCYLKEQSLSNNAIKGHFLDRSISALITPEMWSWLDSCVNELSLHNPLPACTHWSDKLQKSHFDNNWCCRQHVCTMKVMLCRSFYFACHSHRFLAPFQPLSVDVCVYLHAWLPWCGFESWGNLRSRCIFCIFGEELICIYVKLWAEGWTCVSGGGGWGGLCCFVLSINE